MERWLAVDSTCIQRLILVLLSAEYQNYASSLVKNAILVHLLLRSDHAWFSH